MCCSSSLTTNLSSWTGILPTDRKTSWRTSRQIRERWYNLYVNHEKKKPSNSRNTQCIKCRTGCWKHTRSLQWGIFSGIRQDNRCKGGITPCPHKEKPVSSVLSRNRDLLSQYDATSRHAHTNSLEQSLLKATSLTYWGTFIKLGNEKQRILSEQKDAFLGC